MENVETDHRSETSHSYGACVLHFPVVSVNPRSMATKTQVVLVDDLTGDPADTTVKFSLDKTDYEIDLSDANATVLRESLARYVNAARKTSSIGGRRIAPAAKPAYSGLDPAAARAAPPRPRSRLPQAPIRPPCAPGRWGRASRSRRAAASKPESSSSTEP